MEISEGEGGGQLHILFALQVAETLSLIEHSSGLFQKVTKAMMMMMMMMMMMVTVIMMKTMVMIKMLE